MSNLFSHMNFEKIKIIPDPHYVDQTKETNLNKNIIVKEEKQYVSEYNSVCKSDREQEEKKKNKQKQEERKMNKQKDKCITIQM